MSKQLDLSKPLSQEEVDDLLTKWPREKVQYYIEQSSGSEFDEESGTGSEGETEDFGSLSVPELQDRLRDRSLPTSGTKPELVERLQRSEQQG
jgi:SAP domain